MVLGYGGMKRYAKKRIFLKPQYRVIALVNIRYFRKDICVFADDPPSLLHNCGSYFFGQGRRAFLVECFKTSYI